MASVMMAYPVPDGFQGYQQQYAMYQTRAHQPQVEAAQSLHVNPYANYQSEKQAPQYVQPQARSPQPATSIITEDGFRPSLPSISNLLGIADGERGSQDQGSQQAQAQAQPQQPQQQQQTPYQQSMAQPPPQEQRQHNMYPPQDLSSSQRTAIPPTPPPLRNDSVVENTHSPSTISTGSSLSIPQPYYLGSSLNNVEATDQRAAAAVQYFKRPSLPSQPNTSPFGVSPYTSSPYTHSPGAISNGSYYSPTEPQYAQHPGSAPGIYAQRPLPSNFPPQPLQPPQGAQTISGLPPPAARNIWEHHHYISPSSQQMFPQTQDRYVCPTCNKAFSRPSSLKIHSNSHTGEKPYVCPHAGCGKAFSVRSNMKRHQRGCHTEGGGGMMGAHLH